MFKSSEYIFPKMIYGAFIFFIAFFLLDILQGVAGAICIKIFTERQEAKMFEATGSIEGNIAKPKWLDWPSFVLFILKVLSLLIAFIIIGFYLHQKWVIAGTSSP